MPQLDLSASYIKPIVRPYSCTGRRVCFHQSVCTTGILQTPVTNHLYTSLLVTDKSCHPPVCGPCCQFKAVPCEAASSPASEGKAVPHCHHISIVPEFDYWATLYLYD